MMIATAGIAPANVVVLLLCTLAIGLLLGFMLGVAVMTGRGTGG
jgi:hypothetical protein